MRIIRFLGSIALWFGALLGVAAGSIWIGAQLGYIQPMIVISGSMEPDIMTGDLLIGRPAPTDQVEVGDVLSLPSETTGKLVTHRVTSITPLSPERAELFDVDLSQGPRWEVHMQGDANDQPDLEAYFPDERVLTPRVQVPTAGKIVSKVMEPSVALPILLALLALLGLSLLDEEPRKVMRRAIGRVRQQEPWVDELDVELAALGVDVAQLRQMDDLDLQLYALGIDIEPPGGEATAEPRVDDTVPSRVNRHGFEDGLQDFELPPTDGIYDVRWPNEGPPTPSDVGEPVDHRTPARSG